MKKKTLFFFFLFSGFLLLAGVLLWWYFGNQPVCRLSDMELCPEIHLAVNKGEGLSECAALLTQKGLIRNPLIFKIQAWRLGYSRRIQAGEYSLSPASPPVIIAKALTRGSFDRKVTLLEGWRAEEIGESLFKQGIDIELTVWAQTIFNRHLEGMLFPDTYQLRANSSIEEIIEVLTENHRLKMMSALKNNPSLMNMSEKEILVLASLVEREVGHEIDRPVVAGILIKRLKEKWALQVDATVQYALASLKCKPLSAGQNNSRLGGRCDWWPKKLSKEDLQIKSPYNTYLFKGLPPTPICNPGLSAIKAVLNPSDSLYWFYLSDTEGNIHYARTSEEHIANIKKYLR